MDTPIQPHLLATVAKLDDSDLRPMLAALLQRVSHDNGLEYIFAAFPLLRDCYVQPTSFNWPPR
jgi:hypothetical protein